MVFGLSACASAPEVDGDAADDPDESTELGEVRQAAIPASLTELFPELARARTGKTTCSTYARVNTLHYEGVRDGYPIRNILFDVGW